MRWNRIVGAALWLALAAGLLTGVELRAQCAMCWSTLAHSADGASLIRGFNRGILFLLPVPFLITGTLALLLCKLRRQAALEAAFAEWEDCSPAEPAQQSLSAPGEHAAMAGRNPCPAAGP